MHDAKQSATFNLFSSPRSIFFPLSVGSILSLLLDGGSSGRTELLIYWLLKSMITWCYVPDMRVFSAMQFFA